MASSLRDLVYQQREGATLKESGATDTAVWLKRSHLFEKSLCPFRSIPESSFSAIAEGKILLR
jgi:hypothetical protein